MKLPKMYRPIDITFWGLRDGLGDNLGVIPDFDVRVTRKCMRVAGVDSAWKWQICKISKFIEHDYCAISDQLCLDEYANEVGDIEIHWPKMNEVK